MIASVAANPRIVTGTSVGDPPLDEWTASASPGGADPSIPVGEDPAVTFDQARDYTFTVTADNGRGGTASGVWR